MKQSYFILLMFLGMASVLMGFQCRKDYAEPPLAHEYAEKLTLTPYKKSYAVGDTIWIQFQTTDKSLFDKLTNSRVATDTTFLQVRVHLSRLYPNGSFVELFSDAVVDNALDVSYTPFETRYNTLRFNTDCSNNRYSFRAGFVPKKTGIYSLGPGAVVSPCPNKTRFDHSTFTFTFDLADCNKDVYLSIPPGSRGGGLGEIEANIDKKELFVFKVE